MAMNVHNLLHINASVRNHGPLWAHSAFESVPWNTEHRYAGDLHVMKNLLKQKWVKSVVMHY